MTSSIKADKEAGHHIVVGGDFNEEHRMPEDEEEQASVMSSVLTSICLTLATTSPGETTPPS